MSNRSSLSPFAKVAAIVAVGVFGVFAGLFGPGLLGCEDEDQVAFHARQPPAEFLYLDGARIRNYLAQLEGGRVGEEHRVTKETRSAGGEAAASGFTISASSQREDAAERTVTRTEASNFLLMLDGLRSATHDGVSVHPVSLQSAADLRRIREGWLVRFVTDDLLSPGYIRPYVVVRQSATLAALFPTTAGSPTAAQRAERQREKAESFARQVGPNPRITFAVSPADDSLKILLPMQYKSLTDERSMLEKGRDRFTGGRLVVVGKVVRVFEDSLGAPSSLPDYTDFATQEIWRSPLEGASNYLINHVSHSCETSMSVAGSGGGTAVARSVRGRRCFLDKLDQQTQLHAPGAVILPIAVYK